MNPRACMLLVGSALVTACGGDVGSDGGLDATPSDASRWPDAALSDGRVVRGPYATRVVSFDPGPGATFGQDHLPDAVLGPPVGGGDSHGSTDVVSLGAGGRICVAFDDVTIVDGPGPDFIVFENAFVVAGGVDVYAELGEVSVSDDGTHFATFACTTQGPPYPGCAGWHPVYSAPGNGIAADDVVHAGGDAFDLADVGVARARYVCIRDLMTQRPSPPSTGFDLDAIAAVNWQ